MAAKPPPGTGLYRRTTVVEPRTGFEAAESSSFLSH
jgi:hypothetical protein